MLAWLPSRTATVMTFFALASIAAYVRFERLGAARRPADPCPSESAHHEDLISGRRRVWVGLDLVSCLRACRRFGDGRL